MVDFIMEYWKAILVSLLMASVFLGLLASVAFAYLVFVSNKKHKEFKRRYEERRRLNGKATNHRIDL